MGYLWFLRRNCGNIVENLLSATETRGVGALGWWFREALRIAKRVQ